VPADQVPTPGKQATRRRAPLHKDASSTINDHRVRNKLLSWWQFVGVNSALP
jgi:hypothetical protein